jgi:hypothetical protein
MDNSTKFFVTLAESVIFCHSWGITKVKSFKGIRQNLEIRFLAGFEFLN